MDGLKKIPVILDGDPGHDDAIAWVLAKSSPLLDIRACTSVCGNQTIEKTTYNALRICTLIGNHAPFGVGRPRPLVAEPIVVPTVHGKSGLDGPALPEPDPHRPGCHRCPDRTLRPPETSLGGRIRRCCRIPSSRFS